MKKSGCSYSYLLALLVFVAFIPNLNVKAAEIILPMAPLYLFEGSEVLLEVKGVQAPRFKWDFGDGSSETGGRRITHVFRGRGTFNVKVSDPEGKIDPPITKRVTIVRDDREIVISGQMFFPGTPVQMEARNFIDRSIRWDFGDGKDRKLGQTVTHLYSRSGTYTVKAVDFAGRGTKKITKEIRINNDNRSITAPREIIVGEAVEMQLKHAVGGNYTWEFSDGQQTSGMAIKIDSFKRPGTVTVTVKDNSGRYPPLTRQLVVKPDKRRLKSLLKYSLPEESPGFEAEHFRGPVKWDFGDGTIKTNGSKRETHQYKKPGTYKVTARDFNGNSQKTFSTTISVQELSPDFRLTYLEIAFSNGKYYQVAPLKNRPPSYHVKMKATGRGILRGQWMLDGQPIGLFQVILHQNKIADLRGRRVVSLPMKDLGVHDFTVEFSNYNFQQRVPVIRYFVTEADAIRVAFPEAGARVTAPPGKFLELQWKFDDPYTMKKYNAAYQILISEVPIQFLTHDQMKWREAGKKDRYPLDLSTLRGKDKSGTWIYWQVRALKSNGDVLTISEISSFKLVSR
ncbi:MAG: PKD domain-containing protein [Candidatus Aminicenantes bacterium]|jgi:PKD repeat protein